MESNNMGIEAQHHILHQDDGRGVNRVLLQVITMQDK
jgi:hypothetical protein